MAEHYEVGEKYYLPVVVERIDTDYEYPVNLCFVDGGNGDHADIADMPNLLLTAGEIAADFRCRKNIEKDNRLEKLLVENDLLKADKATLSEKNDALEADLQNAKAAIDHYHEVEHRRAGYTDKQTQEINRKNKEIEILIDRITKLEAELAEEKEKHNG